MKNKYTQLNKNEQTLVIDFFNYVYKKKYQSTVMQTKEIEDSYVSESTMSKD